MPESAVYLETSIALAASPATVSSGVAIGNPTELGLIVPTLDPAATVTVKVSMTSDAADAKILVDGTGTQKLTYASGTGGFAISSNEMGGCLGYEYLFIEVGTAQTLAKTFTLVKKTVGTDPTA